MTRKDAKEATSTHQPDGDVNQSQLTRTVYQWRTLGREEQMWGLCGEGSVPRYTVTDYIGATPERQIALLVEDGLRGEVFVVMPDEQTLPAPSREFARQQLTALGYVPLLEMDVVVDFSANPGRAADVGLFYNGRTIGEWWVIGDDNEKSTTGHTHPAPPDPFADEGEVLRYQKARVASMTEVEATVEMAAHDPLLALAVLLS